MEELKKKSFRYMKPWVIAGTICAGIELLLFCFVFYWEVKDFLKEEVNFNLYEIISYIISREGIFFLPTLGAITILPLFFCIWQVVRNARGSNQKMIKKYCKRSPDYDMALKEVEEFYRTTSPVEVYDFMRTSEFWISRKFFMGSYGVKTLFLESREILWVYHTVEPHSSRGMKTYTLYPVKLMLRNGRHYKLSFDNYQAAVKILDRIRQTMPFVYIGKSKEMKKKYRKNRKELIKKVDQAENKIF